MKYNILIAEKPGLAKKIACALCNEKSCDKRSCMHYHTDLYVHHARGSNKYEHPIKQVRCRSGQIDTHKLPKYLALNRGSLQQTALAYSSGADKINHRQVEKSLDRILKDWDKQDGKKPVKEKVDWYWIPKGFMKDNWLVLQTNGNPQRLKFSNNSWKANANSYIPPIDQFEIGASYSPQHSSTNSYRCRMMLFSHHIETSRESINKIIVGTDMDIAGSYIPTTLPGFSKFDRRNILRIHLNKTTEEEIRNAINNTKEYDWENAMIGKTRAYIDFLIDFGFRNVLNDINKSYNLSASLSIGRNLILSLLLISQRWRDSFNFKEQGVLYLVFMGMGDKGSIEASIKKNTFAAAAMRTKRGPFSPAGLIKVLTEAGIGTVSTRYKIIDRLISKKLIEKHDDSLIPTEKGLAIADGIIPIFNNEEFSLIGYNAGINKLIAGKADDNPANSLFRNDPGQSLLAKFIREYNKCLVSYRSELSDIIKEIAEIPDPDNTSLDNKGNKNKSYKHPLEEAPDLAAINEYIDFDTNTMNLSEEIILHRESPKQKTEWTDILRQVLGLEREVEYQLINGFNLEHIPFLQEDFCTVFRANIPIDKIGTVMEDIQKTSPLAGSFHKLTLETPATDQEKGAHEPLGLFDINPEDIPGPEGFKLAAEYMRPYRHTMDLYKAIQAGADLTLSFSLDDMEFMRFMPFEYGSVHTLDSVMAAMYERYKISFSDTAKLAEELYLA